MLGLHRHTGLRVGWVRTAIEVSALIVGYLLGGTVGVGTAIFALGIGPAVDAAFRLFDVHPTLLRRTDVRASLTAQPTASDGKPASCTTPELLSRIRSKKP
ncbi:MAG: hypothetical protein WKH64_01700 [Chloroflexia bacterium]